MRGPWNSMANLLDEALREIYKERMGRDPLWRRVRVKFFFSCFSYNLFALGINSNEDKL
jgi:hypothetical protein